MKFLTLIFLILALLFESTITTIPLIFVVLLGITVIFKENWIFSLAFIFGVLFDLITFKAIGITSIYFLSFIFLILIYQRKFEISTNYFVLISSFIGSIGFLISNGIYNLILIQSVISSVLALIIFKLLKKIMLLNSKSTLNY